MGRLFFCRVERGENLEDINEGEVGDGEITLLHKPLTGGKSKYLLDQRLTIIMKV